MVAHFPFAAHFALAVMLIAALVGATIDVRFASWKALSQRLRLSGPNATDWIWVAALSGFMYGGNGKTCLRLRHRGLPFGKRTIVEFGYLRRF